MNTTERIQLVEQKIVEKLQKVDTIPQDLANKYSLWMQGKVAEAAQQLAAQNTPVNPQEAAS